MKHNNPNLRQTDSSLYTRNLVEGQDVYGERLKHVNGEEYRRWDPSRSKLGAALMKGLEDLPIQPESQVLYLGAATGTTPSHISDICPDGIVYGVEYADQVIRNLLKLSQDRHNLAPILADARKPDTYSGLVDKVDIVFQDIAQPDQFEILKRNTDMFLRENGEALLALKARSISSSQSPEKTFSQQTDKLQQAYQILWKSRLEPYEKDHMFYRLKKK